MGKSAIITAAGSGRRFGEAKQFKKLHGKPLYEYSLDTFIKSSLFDEVILVIPNNNQEKIKREIKREANRETRREVNGEAKREAKREAN